MSDVKYDSLYDTIIAAHRELREKDPEHELLGLLLLSEGKITCTPKFDERYRGKHIFTYQQVTQYATDLLEAINE